MSLRSTARPGRDRGADQDGDDDGAAAQVAAHQRERDHRHGRRGRGRGRSPATHRARFRPRRRRSRRAPPSAAAGRGRRGTPSPKTSAIVESAARSCSPMNDPCRLPPLTTNSTAPQATATVQKATRKTGELVEPLGRVSMNAAAPSARTAKSDSFPAAVTRARRVRDRADDDQHARRRRSPPSSQGEGTLPAEPELADREHRRDEQRRVGRADRERRAADADVQARQVGRPKQAEADGDEEDVEREFGHRQPCRAWRRAGHRESL